MKSLKIIVLLVGLVFLVACGGKKRVTIEVEKELSLQVGETVKLKINHIARNLEFEGMKDIIEIKVNGDKIYIKALKTGDVALKVSYKPDKNISKIVAIHVKESGVIEKKEYTLSFEVAVPEGTEGEVFVVGDFSNWLDNPASPVKLTKQADGKYKGTTTYKTSKTVVEYKYVNAEDLASLNYNYEEIIEENRTLTLSNPTATDTVSAWKNGGYKGEAVEKEYTLNFEITVPFALPEGYKVWVVGFDGLWEAINALALTGEGLVYTGSKVISTTSTEIEYMVVTGETFSYDHKPLKADGSEYSFGENIGHTLVDGVNEVKYTVHAWKDLSAPALEVEYEMSFTVSVPETTAGKVFLVGDFTGWLDEGHTAIEMVKQADGTYKASVTYKTSKTAVEYKYINAKDLASLSWDFEEIIDKNRSLDLSEPNAVDTVSAWKDGGYKESLPEVEYTVTFEITIPYALEAGYSVVVIGDFNEWDQTAPLVLTNEGLVYTGTATYSTANTQLEYMVVALAGESFSWDHKALKEDLSEYAFEENMVHELVEGVNNIEITIPGWKGLSAPALEVEYTLNFEVTVPFALPEGYKVWVVGFDGLWEAINALALTGEGLVYTGSKVISTTSTEIEYMVVTGETFSYDHKPLKADGSEYSFGENIGHTLVDGVNEIKYTVHAWKGLSETPVEPQEYTITFNAEVPADYEGDVYVVGKFNEWAIEEAILMTKKEDGTYTHTATFELALEALEYKYFNHKDWQYGEVNDEGEARENRSLLLTETTLTTQDIILGFENIYVEPVEPDIRPFTVKLGDIPASTGELPIKLIGTMTNDWSTEDALTFEKVEDVLQVTFNIDYNLEHSFKVYLDKAQADWAAHQAASDIDTPWQNYELKLDYLAENEAVTMAAIPFWLGLENPELPVEPQEYTITFNAEVPADYEGDVYVVGKFNEWAIEEAILMTKKEDGTYTHTATFELALEALEYKYFNHKDWQYGEVNDEGEARENRSLLLTETTLTTQDIILGFENIYVEPVEPDIRPFTVKLGDIPASTGELPIKLIGTMTNDWSTEDALTFEKVEDVLQVTFNIDYNLDHLFLLYLEKGQANWWDHKAADSINEGWDNYILKADYLANNTEVSLDVAYWLGLENTIAATILTQSDFGATNSTNSNYALLYTDTVINGSKDPNPAGTSSWDRMGGNYNNTAWDYIRMGGKADSVLDPATVYLKTNFTFTDIITSIVINIVALDSAAGDETIHLQTSTDGETWITITSKTTIIGDLAFNDLNIEAGSYVRFVFERGSTGSNAGTDIKLITFYG